MGSYCTLKFNDLSIDSYKSAVPDEFVSIFQECDRLELDNLDDDDENEGLGSSVLYRTSRESVLKRLDILGFTSSATEAAFNDWLKSERATYLEYALDGDWAKDTSDALNNFSFEEWKRRVLIGLQVRYSSSEREEYPDVTTRQMEDFQGEWLTFDGGDRRFFYRAVLDACPELNVITLDISDLVHSGYIASDELICQTRRDPTLFPGNDLGTTVIMAEGSSDIRALKSSLSALYPDVTDYFSFFEHNEMRVDGGASYLVKFLKAFAGARIPTKIIAIFDNDTEGVRHYKLALSLNLPKNISVLKLPDVGLATNYPTNGPQGMHNVDVNGLACGIEMYYGRYILTDSAGYLVPVRWTSYSSESRSYQGELEGSKVDLANRFDNFIKTHNTTDIARTMHPEMDQIWQCIFECVRSPSLSVLAKRPVSIQD